MADPVLDEDHIKSLLSHLADSADQVDRIAGGVACFLIDVYDRKVEREFYITHLAEALQLYSDCCKSWMLHRVRQTYDRGNLDGTSFDRAAATLKEMIEVRADQFIEHVKLLQQCPTSKDIIS